MVTRLHLPHAIVVMLHVRKSNVVILTPETAGTVGVRAVVYPCCIGIALNCSRRAPGYFAYLQARLNLPQTIVVRLHLLKIGVVILKPETVR